MLKTLQEISKKAILLNDFEFSAEQVKSEWLGTTAAEDKEIADTEERLSIKLPEEYKAFLKITNGFPQTSSIDCSFLPVDKIDYLKTIDADLVEIWLENDDLRDVGEALESSILIGGLNEEQQFLLIPPSRTRRKWGYWKFANWIPGQEEYSSLKDYLKSDLSFLKEQTKGLKTAKPKVIIDYSLREALFNLDWDAVYALSQKYIVENKRYGYFSGGADLFALLLLSASKTNRQEELHKLIETFKNQNAQGMNSDNINLNNSHLLNKYSDAVRDQNLFIPDFQKNNFAPKESSMSLEDIEKQIEKVRKDLLKEKNRTAKLEYQLYFLFAYGSADDFIELYEQNYAELSADAHLKAAAVYVHLDKYYEPRTALRRYFRTAFDYRPFEPFLCEKLLPLIDEDLIATIDN